MRRLLCWLLGHDWSSFIETWHGEPGLAFHICRRCDRSAITRHDEQPPRGS